MRPNGTLQETRLSGDGRPPAGARIDLREDPGLGDTLPETRRRIEAKLYLDRFQADESSHIRIIDQDTCRRCPEKWCNYLCPAAVYEYDTGVDRNLVSYEGCVECGTCRIGCPYRNIDWQFPRGGFGIQHRFG